MQKATETHHAEYRSNKQNPLRLSIRLPTLLSSKIAISKILRFFSHDLYTYEHVQ